MTEPVFTDLAEAPTVVSASIDTESVAFTDTSVAETVLPCASSVARAAPLTRFIATMPETASASALAALAEAVTSLPSSAAMAPEDSASTETAPEAVTALFVISATAWAGAALPRLVPTIALSVSKARLLLA
ncbi:hypothetical protein GCM10007888_17830 [Methylobacterium oxalidis]|uniref:Uncharacterized protein n=1 Tax=Methylobacterium oxalidis TaxID=944322 RepID=A0ABQ6DIF1_9HYPH|nr:hypothetical protein GCM10007888_17830 [Methylobacterium oxalidis]